MQLILNNWVKIFKWNLKALQIKIKKKKKKGSRTSEPSDCSGKEKGRMQMTFLRNDLLTFIKLASIAGDA